MEETNRRRFLKWSSAAVSTVGLAGCLGEEGEDGDFPSKPLTNIIPYGEGGGSDLYSRNVLPQMSDDLGVEIRHENVSGAGGLRGTQRLFDVDSDGYSIAATNPPLEVIGALAQDSEFDLREVTGIGSVARASYLLVAHPDHEIDDLDDLLGRYQSGELSAIGTQSPGGGDHISAVIMRDMDEYNWQWEEFVAYDGTGPVLEAVISNEVPVGFGTGAATKAVEDQLDVIAALQSEGSPPFPNVPSVVDEGYSNLDFVGGWTRGWIAPPNVSQDRIKVLSNSLEQAVKSDEAQEWAEETSNHLEWVGGREHIEGLIADAYETIPEYIDFDELD